MIPEADGSVTGWRRAVPSRARSPGRERQARQAMNSGQIGLLLLGATAFFALWAAIFATRADMATRRSTRLAGERLEASTKAVPHITFTDFAAPGQSIQLQGENLGGILAGCGMILQK